MKIAVAGATGRVGKHVAELLEADRVEVVPISRAQGVDVITGEGLDRALEGVERIIDATANSSPDQKAATEFFTTATHHLLDAGKRAGVQDIIVVSIIGIDRFTAGYMAAKRAHERAVAEGPLPARIVRAAQFHELVPQMVAWGKQGGVSHVPAMRTQLVAARAVAEILAGLATGRGPAIAPGPSGAPTVEVAGPRPEELVDAARRLVARRGDPVRIEGVTDPADPERALWETAFLAGPRTILAGPTFDEWLGRMS